MKKQAKSMIDQADQVGINRNWWRDWTEIEVWWYAKVKNILKKIK